MRGFEVSAAAAWALPFRITVFHPTSSMAETSSPPTKHPDRPPELPRKWRAGVCRAYQAWG